MSTLDNGPMDLQTELNYDASPAEVFAMLIDEAFLARKAKATGAFQHEAEVTRGSDAVRIRLHRVLPPEVPDYARRLIGDRLDVVQVDEWGPAAADGSRTGTFTVEIKGVPATMRGTLRLARRPDGGTVETVSATIKAGIPLIGRKIEEAAADAVLSAAHKEEQVGHEWLGSSPS